MNRTIIALLLLSAMSGGVSAESQPNVVAEPSAPSGSQSSHRGRVLEVVESPMYTYLHVATDAGTIWLAAYKNGIVKGDVIRYPDGVAMRNFHSKSLKRSFDRVIFVNAVVVEKNTVAESK